MAPRKTKIRSIIEDYAAGKRKEVYALGSGLVFISPAGVGKNGEYYLQAKITPPKGKEFWVCTCKGFRFSEKNICRHVGFLDEKVDEVMEKIIETQDAPRKEITKAIKDGRKARTKKK